MTISINDLKNGMVITVAGDPYAVLEVRHQHIGRGGSNVQTKLKNIRTGQLISKNFKPADELEEAEIEKMKSRFLYENRGLFWFDEIGNPKNRFSLKSEIAGEAGKFLKPNLEITAIKFRDAVINVELPVKVDFKVVEAPPALRGDTAQGGSKAVTIETGAKISVPLFINEGDVIRVNTQTGEYAERIEKG